MKALSGRQPWWWAILHAGKRIENRVWNTNYRGPVLLHAAKGCTREEFNHACIWMENAGVVPTPMHPSILADMPRGGIVGRARIVDVIRPKDGLKRVDLEREGFDMRWWMTDQYGFVLADVEPLPFVPYRGALSLFDIPESVLDPTPLAVGEP